MLSHDRRPYNLCVGADVKPNTLDKKPSIFG